MKTKKIAAMVGAAAAALTVVLAPAAAAHDSGDSPTVTVVRPGIHGQIPDQPPVPTAQLGVTVTAKPPAAILDIPSAAPITRATAAPSCNPSVYVPECDTLP